MLNWSEQFSIFILLDNNHYTGTYNRYEYLIAVNSVHTISGSESDLPDQLYQFHAAHRDWLFGHICYDYKNQLEPGLTTRNPEKLGFPDFHFFRPEIICYIHADKKHFTVESLYTEPKTVWQAIQASDSILQEDIRPVNFLPAVSQPDYIRTIEQLKAHIAAGDCYEINFCTQASGENIYLKPQSVFHKLNRISPAPFAAFYRLEEKYMMCASPERYLWKDQDIIISQPIKGTARRDKAPEQDLYIKEQLRENIKERAENVMIVDLVRNDLARSCITGSVTVPELFGIYSFPQVHQMISTVMGRLRKDIPFTDTIKRSFPMGSMTGAPKIKVMELIDRYEKNRRELFSGTVGYITPGGDFDFNVIIRSLFYHADRQYLSYHTGGAITWDSDPLKEWEEMRLKAWALERVFNHTPD